MIITTVAIHLHVMLGEDRSPERLETFWIPPGINFEDEFMDNDDAQENGSNDGDDKVVCTSNIGLKKVTRDGISVIVKSKVTVFSSRWSYRRSIKKFSRELFNCLHNQLEEIRRTVQGNLFGEQGDDASGCLFNIYHEMMRVDSQGHS